MNIAEKIAPLKSYLPGIEKELLSRTNTPKYPLSSLPLFSDKIFGMKEGLTLIGARTSQGKSSFAAQVAWDLANQNIPVLFLSLEMTVDNIIERLFCHACKIDNYKVMRGDFCNYNSQWDVFRNTLSQLKLLITCGIGKTMDEVNTLVEGLDPMPKVVIVDYVQGVARSGAQSREQLNEYIRKFRELMLKNKSVGVLCSQVNRNAKEDKNEPSLWTLKETGSLEETADMAILLHWEHFYTYNEEKKNEFKLYIAKNRNGRCGKHDLLYYPEYYMFTEVNPGHPTDEQLTMDEAGRRYK